MCDFVCVCVLFVSSLLGMPKNENAQESKRCWNIMRMCAFLCVLLVSLLLGMPKNAIGAKSKQCWNSMGRCAFLCVILVLSVFGMPKNVIAQEVQKLLRYYDDVCILVCVLCFIIVGDS